MSGRLTEDDQRAIADAIDLSEMDDADLREYFGVGLTRDAKAIAFEQARAVLDKLVGIIERIAEGGQA